MMSLDERINMCERLLLTYDRYKEIDNYDFYNSSVNDKRVELITLMLFKLGVATGNSANFINDYFKSKGDCDFCPLNEIFNFLCENSSWSLEVYVDSAIDMVAELNNKLKLSEDEYRKLSSFAINDLQALWSDNCNGYFKQLKEAVMNSISYVDQRLTSQKYKNLMCSSLMNNYDGSSFYSYIVILRNEKLPILLKNHLINEKFLEPLKMPLLCFSCADAEYEEDFSLIVFETGVSDYSGNLDMYMSNSKLMVAMYYVELISKKNEHLF